MDRWMIEQHLAQAEDRVRLGKRHIVRQRQIVEELLARGRPTGAARHLLATFEGMQQMHAKDRNRLRDLAAQLGPLTIA
jgi:hypothetical protein